MIFPVLVLGVFSWLVSRHSGKLYGPGDWKDEENYIRMQVAHLEARVETSTTPPGQIATKGPPGQALHSDSRLAIAQIRLDVERELFLLARHTLKRDDIHGWPVSRYIQELEKDQVIDHSTGDNLRSLVDLANKIVHEPGVPDEQVERAASVGATLIALIRHRRLVAQAAQDFEGHLLWHMHHRAPDSSGRYQFWSAVAESLPELDWDYDVYREATEKYNQKVDLNHESRLLPVLTLEEFVSVLEFREHEVLRLIKAWPWERDTNVACWQWPDEWGPIGWRGPILRERAHLWGAQEDLIRTRAALVEYRRRLQFEKAGASVR